MKFRTKSNIPSYEEFVRLTKKDWNWDGITRREYTTTNTRVILAAVRAIRKESDRIRP
jgi:hypothetical protein